jgi:uncharacterized protein
LIQRVHGEEVVPRRLPVNADTLALAADLIALFRGAQGRTRGALEAALEVLEGDQIDYRLKRGLALAKLLPALLHVTRWQLTTTLVPRQQSSSSQGTRFTLEAGCGLVSHYPPGKPYDSILEQAFAARWAQTPTAWRLEREVDLIPLPGSVMVPDFRLVHPDGRSYLFEIVGYWRPEYLRKKFAQVRRAGREDVILAVSERLNLERAGVRREDLPARVVWFKERVLPQAVLDMLEG